jgi:anti-sigma B factor antagonist
MDFSWSKQGQGIVLKLKGRMDAVTAPEFEKECTGKLDQGERSFVVDLSGVDYISSAGLRSILSAAKKLKAVQGKICFCNLKGMVQEVFSVSGFASMFPMYASIEEALAKN